VGCPWGNCPAGGGFGEQPDEGVGVGGVEDFGQAMAAFRAW